MSASMMSIIALATVLMSMLGACAPLPEVKYETDRLQIAPDFDDPICEGTLFALDEHLEKVEDGLGEVGVQEPLRLYWMREQLADTCGEGRGGCFFPSTRMMFARSRSITHEMTHAVLDSEGDSYFLEEGMAELLSGVGVYHDLAEDQSTPGQRLRMSRSEYRAGGFDYDAAAHFMRYVFDHRGFHAVRRLATEVEAGATPERLESILEEVMGRDIDEIEANYRRNSRAAYEGLSYEDIAAIDVESVDTDPSSLGPEWLTLSAEVELDCLAEDTMGPLPEDREGMYQVRRVWIPKNRGAVVRVEGDPGTWARVFDPYARSRHGVMTDWMMPNAQIDEDGLEVAAGETITGQLRAGTWAVMLGADYAGAGRVTVHVDLLAPPPPPDPNETI